MVNVKGRFNDGDLSGVVIATPTAPFSDPSNPGVLIVLPYEEPINNGNFTINIPQSEELSIDNSPTEVVSYRWEVYKETDDIILYLEDGTIYEGRYHQFDGNYYTGIEHTDESILLDFENDIIRTPIIRPFFASVPNLDEINFEDLIGIPINLEHINISLHALAKLLITNDTYRNELTTQLNLAGEFNPETVYQLGDVVRFNGNSYYFINTVNGSAPPPFEGDDENWILLVEKGDPGGTGAQSIGYDPEQWQQDSVGSEASSRKDVSEAIEQLRGDTSQIDLSNYLTRDEGVQRNNPVFTGTPKRPEMTYPIDVNNRPTELVTAQYVQDALATTSASKFPKPLIYGRRLIPLTFSQNVNQTITWDSVPVGREYVSQQDGAFTLPSNAIYRVSLNLKLLISGNERSVSNYWRYYFRAFILRQGDNREMCTLLTNNKTPFSGEKTVILMTNGDNYIKNDSLQNNRYQIKFFLTADENSLTNSGHIISPNAYGLINDNYASHTYLRIWEEST